MTGEGGWREHDWRVRGFREKPVISWLLWSIFCLVMLLITTIDNGNAISIHSRNLIFSILNWCDNFSTHQVCLFMGSSVCHSALGDAGDTLRSFTIQGGNKPLLGQWWPRVGRAGMGSRGRWGSLAGAWMSRGAHLQRCLLKLHLGSDTVGRGISLHLDPYPPVPQLPIVSQTLASRLEAGDGSMHLGKFSTPWSRSDLTQYN